MQSHRQKDLLIFIHIVVFILCVYIYRKIRNFFIHECFLNLPPNMAIDSPWDNSLYKSLIKMTWYSWLTNIKNEQRKLDDKTKCLTAALWLIVILTQQHYDLIPNKIYSALTTRLIYYQIILIIDNCQCGKGTIQVIHKTIQNNNSMGRTVLLLATSRFLISCF